MIRALAPLAVRHLATHARAASVAMLALACGVATLLASQLLYQAVIATYEDTTARFVGRAALLVANGDAGVGDEVAEEIQQVAGVRAAARSVEGFVALPDLPGERLYLYGVDLLADQDVRDYGAGADAVVSDPLVFLAESDSVAITREFAVNHGLREGDRLRVLTPQGVTALTVRALLGDQRGVASVLDGRLAVVDLSVAQDLLQMNGRVSQIAVALGPDADVDVVRSAVAARVSGRGTVELPRARTAGFARLLSNYRYGLLLAATIAMVVALFFVVNIATIAVVERRGELGLLRLVGVRARHLVALVAAEVSLLAAVAAACGVPLGIVLARCLGDSFGATTAALYGEMAAPQLDVRPSAVALSVAVGIVAPLLSIVGPIRSVLAVAAMDALRMTTHDRAPGGGRFGAAASAGAIAVAGAAGLWISRSWLPVPVARTGLVVMLGGVVGTALCVPFAFAKAVRFVEHRASARWPFPFLQGLRNIAADLGPTAITASALLVGLAGTIAVATWVTSIERSLAGAFDTVFGSVDLLVSGGADPFSPEAVRVPEAMADAVAALDGVAYVDPVRLDRLAFEGARVAVVATDAGLYGDGRRRLYMVEGDERAAADALASGTGVVVNQTFATRFHRRVGDVIELATPTGPLAFRIAGIHLELTPGDLGTIRMDRTRYRRAWRDTSVSLIEVTIAPGADRATVGDAIRARFGETHRVVVLTVEALRAEYDAMLGQLTRLLYPLLAVAIACGLVGVASGRVAVMLARRRVAALLRAVGATRAQLAWSYACEGAFVAVISALLALVVGSALGWTQVQVLLRGMLGMSVAYAYPVTVALVGACATVAMTTAIGWLLGRRAGGECIAGGLLAP